MFSYFFYIYKKNRLVITRLKQVKTCLMISRAVYN